MAGHFIEMQTYSGGKPGTEFVTKQLRQHIAGYDDLRKLFDDLYSAVIQYEARGWDRANIAGSWGDLADSTIEQKRRQGYPFAILVRTRNLKESLTEVHGNFQIHTVGKKEMTFGTSVEYAYYHQTGPKTKRDQPNWKLPRRMVIPTAVVFNKEANTKNIMERFQFGICREVYRR